MFFSILGFFRLHRRVVGTATILGLIAYMLITGMSPSVVRATIMAIVILLGTMTERKADIYNSISVAAIILLLWNTNTLFDVGFQLSFAAVISIVYFYPRLELLIKKIPEQFEEIKGIDALLKLFAVSLAAQLGTIPFTAYYFDRVSVISLLANLVVVPISGFNTFIGFAEVAFSFISHWIADLFAAANEFLVWFLLGFVKQTASVPFAYLEIWNLSIVTIVGYYVLVIGLFNFNLLRIRVWMLIFILALGNFVIFADVWSVMHPKLIITMLDVGQGDAILVEFPNGECMLIDAGPTSQRYDVGEKSILPFLKRKGVNKLNYFIITHPHSDHLGGAKAILSSIPIDALLVASLDPTNQQTNEILETASVRRIEAKTVGTSDQIQINPNARIYVLNPDRNQSTRKNLNNTSIVLMIKYGRSSVLLVGDAEIEVEQRMMKRYGNFLSSDILKVGHHGSISSTSEDFLRVVRPKEALISVGNHNRFRHPSIFTIQRLASYSIETIRTDKSGAIIFESDGIQWTRDEWRHR
jgi:competence protein ComEC